MPAAAQATLEWIVISGCDVPTRLGGVDYLPGQIVGVVPGGYALVFDGMTSAGFPPGTRIDALAVIEGPADPNAPDLTGVIAFSVDTQLTVGAMTFGPADIIEKTASGLVTVLSAASMGLPESADIDGLARTETGEWIVSFDAPVTVGPATYQPADLVRVSAAGLSPFLIGASIGLGPDTNVIGFEKSPGPSQLYFTFDAPVTVGANTFLPGQIVKYDGAAFSLFFGDPLFPPESALTDFSLPPSPGAVPDGFDVPGVPLSVVTAPGGQIKLSWGAACIPSGSDYAVYEGVLGSYYSHASKLCTTGGSTSALLTPGTGSRYYLVVPTNALFEGSYGNNSLGIEIPVGGGACRMQKLGAPTCP